VSIQMMYQEPQLYVAPSGRTAVAGDGGLGPCENRGGPMVDDTARRSP
jgi:hypothetical protein